MQYISLAVNKYIAIIFILFYNLDMNKKEKLKKAGETYASIAQRIGVTERTVFNWFNDKTPISVPNAYKLEAITGGVLNVSDFKNLD